MRVLGAGRRRRAAIGCACYWGLEVLPAQPRRAQGLLVGGRGAIMRQAQAVGEASDAQNNRSSEK